MREGNFVKKFIAVFGFVLMFVLLIGVEAKADLVDDLIKKYNLDPKNNPKDQCELMYLLSDEDVAVGCEKSGICSLHFAIYNFDKQKNNWEIDKHNHVMIYKKNPYKILGIFGYILQGLDEENRDFDLYKKTHKGFPYKSYVLSDIRSAKEFKFALQQKEQMLIKDFNDGSLRLIKSKNALNKNSSYIKVRGCYVEDFRIIDSDKKNYQPKNRN